MTHNPSEAALWLSRNKGSLFPVLALAIPFLVRAVPEVLMGQYLVGFDTMGYYVPNTILWLKNGISVLELTAYAPLLYVVTIAAASTGASLVVFLKILSPLLLGFLGFIVYEYARLSLLWEPRKSLFVALVSTLYFVALRISWDMLRSELALVFLFTTLIFLQRKSTSKKNGLLLTFLMLLVVLSHQLVAVIMFGVMGATLFKMLLKKENGLHQILAASVPATVLFCAVIFLNTAISSSFLGYSSNFSGGIDVVANLSFTQLVVNTLGFLLFCYLPLVPLLVFSKRFKGDFQLLIWMATLLIPVGLAITTPYDLFVGGVLPYRWILLLTYPLSFFVIEAVLRIKWKKYKITIGVVLAVLSMAFMVLPNAQTFSYFSMYTDYTPKSMLQNTVQLSDCQDTVDALKWARINLPVDASLMVHEAFYGYALLNYGNNGLEPYVFDDLANATQRMVEKGTPVALYLVWWVNGTGWYGEPNVPEQFKELHHEGNIAIYQYLTGD